MADDKTLSLAIMGSMEKIEILGIKVSKVTKAEVLGKIKGYLTGTEQRLVVTPNPEIILEASRDEELFFILNKADLALPDGFGLKLAAWLEGERLERITGADISQELLAWSEKEAVPVGFIIWKKGLSSKEDLEKALRNKYPSLKFSIEAADRNPCFVPGKDFLATSPKIVFVALGCPWQEKVAYHALPKMPSVRVALGVGGTPDFITGRLKRAPGLFRGLGLEWLWRLIRQPKRIGRISNAVIAFPISLFKRKFLHPLFYRPNVSCLLYKKDGAKYKILLVERQGEPEHWQLPQGGTEGEGLLKAGERELKEEINTDRFIAKRVFKDLYRYSFGTRPGETEAQAENRRRHTGYKGQKQGLFIAEFVGQDTDVRLNFWDHSAWKWVDSDKLVDEVHLIRRRAAGIFLKKFKEFVKQK
jgi:N-acetylglucosaminyldiphosphoundecaprenol N-acetyl-beta-D-mannosaminyltransferase